MEYRNNFELMNVVKNNSYNFGKIICKCELVDCIYMTEEYVEEIKQNNYQEYICGVYEVGRFAWILKNIEILSNLIEAKGHLGIWNYSNS